MPSTFKKIRYGYLNSLFSCVIGSGITGEILTINSLVDGSVADSLLGFFPLTIFLIAGSFFFCIFSNAIVGSFLYSITMQFPSFQKHILSSIGIAIGMVLGYGFNNSLMFSIFGAIYGGLSGYLFWRGATNMD